MRVNLGELITGRNKCCERCNLSLVCLIAEFVQKHICRSCGEHFVHATNTREIVPSACPLHEVYEVECSHCDKIMRGKQALVQKLLSGGEGKDG